MYFMRKRMHQETFGTFYSTVCHVCKSMHNQTSLNGPLKSCQGCKLISYCGVDHQQQHWPQHRHFCKTIQRLMKTLKVAYIYESAEALESTSEWCKLRTKVRALCEVMLKRPLSTCESDMLYFPSVCLVCYKYDPKNFKLCRRCLCVCYCSNEHMEDNAMNHRKSCRELKMGFDLDLCAISESLLDITFRFGGRTFCNSADNFITGFMEYAFQSNNFSNNLVKSVYFTILSCPLTLIHSVFTAGLHLSEKLVVHLVGSSVYESQHLVMWDIVFHWLPNLKLLHLILIGPDVLQSSELAMCAECELAGCKLTVEFCPGQLYHNYVASSDFTQPDMIIMFNCGLSEFVGSKEDTWYSSIPCIMTLKCPVVITSYTVSEAENDLLRLLVSDKRVNVLVRCKKNVFAAKKPIRDWEQFNSNSDSLVFYHNAFISILDPKT